jgi:hypothetical protein
MDPKQIIALASKLVAHQEELEALETDEGQWAISNPAAAIKLMIADIKLKFVSESTVNLQVWKRVILKQSDYGVDLVLMSLRELGFRSPQSYKKFLTPRFCDTWSYRNLSGMRIKLLDAFDDGEAYFKLRNACDKKSLGQNKRIWVATSNNPSCFKWSDRCFRAQGYSYNTFEGNLAKGIFPPEEVFVFELVND